MDEYIKSVRGARFSSMPAGSAKHSAPQPGDVRAPAPPAVPQAGPVVHMPTVPVLHPLAPAAYVPTSHPAQPPALADGVVRCRVEEIYDSARDGELLGKLAVIGCPGCGGEHGLWVWKSPKQPPRPIWQFDGDLVAPTFSPSLRCFHTRRDGTEQTDCHTFIKGGWIQFLDDSAAHSLRGWHKLPAVRD